MAILNLGLKQRIINDAKTTPVTITGAGQSAVINIEGFGKFPVANLKGTVKAVRGVPSNLHKVTITPANVTITNPQEGDEVVVKVKFKSNNLTMEYAKNSLDHGKTKNLYISLSAGETAESFLEKLDNQIQEEILQDGYSKLTSTPTVDGVSGDITSLAIEATEEGVTFEIGTFEDTYTPSKKAKVSGAAVVQGFEGRGTYRQLRTVRLETAVSNAPFSQNALQLPIEGAVYSALAWEIEVERDHVTGAAAAGANVASTADFELIIKEDGGDNDTFRNTILDALLTKTGIATLFFDKNNNEVPTKAEFLA
jgi:hypothetical protein